MNLGKKTVLMIVFFLSSEHEHINNFCIEYEGVKLVYGLKTGIGSYHEKDMLGGTLLTFSRDGQVQVEHILDIE